MLRFGCGLCSGVCVLTYGLPTALVGSEPSEGRASRGYSPKEAISGPLMNKYD